MTRPSKNGPPALFFTDDGTGHFQCRLCPHHCRMTDGQDGLCRVRGVREGKPHALGYGVISAAHVDPMEKKPLYHFFPGETIYSIGGWGCNLACFFCQNWSISQVRPAGVDRVTPEQIVRATLANRCRHLAFTYNEPLIGYEFVLDTAKLARAAGVSTVLVTNGYIEAEPAAGLLPWIDALNIDIKSMEEDFYRQHCRGTLSPILNFCRQAVKQGCHVEITNLVIPTLNDRPDLIRQLARWIGTELGTRVPLHLSAYHPDHECALPPTTAEILSEAVRVAREELQYVYAGNLAVLVEQDTSCPQCGNVWIRRQGYQVERVGLSGIECARCRHPFEGRIGSVKTGAEK
jgi:pyruvate formate lyase activating enzyme